MKRFLLSFVLLALITSIYAQKVVINEIYPAPGSSGQNPKTEYFELFNTTGQPVNLDCYTIVAIDVNANPDVVWVFQLPAKVIEPFGHFVFGSSNPIIFQGSQANPSPYTGNNQFDWNSNEVSSRLTKYVRDASNNLDEDLTFTGPLTDLIPISGGNGPAISLMLFNGGTLENAFFGNSQSAVPSEITSLNPLLVGMFSDVGDPNGCGTNATLTFSNLAGSGVETFALTQNVGSDNGFYRERDGFCGTWGKSANSGGNTPGMPNSSLPPINSSGAISITATPPVNCGATWNVSITVNDAALLEATYRIYTDNAAPFGQLNPGDEMVANGVITTTAPEYVTGIQAIKDRDMYVQVITSSGCIQVTKTFSTSCTILPVNFRSFSAARNKEKVALKWETASEQNNRGFYIQRNIKGNWENVAFVFSAAENGNSSSLLTYTYNDLNMNKGVSQYRIQQVDLDGRIKYSDIRSVRGEEQSSKTIVYPNPSLDGKVNVVFENQGAKHVVVSDMSGRIIRKYQSVVNTLQVDNLETGVYTIQITDLSSGVTTTEKVLIKKR